MRTTKEVDNGPFIVACKYIGTTGMILSWLLTAMGHFPYNLLVELVGASAWLYVGIRWKDFNICYLHCYLLFAITVASFTQGLF